MTFDRTMIDPQPEQWDAAFAEAVAEANARFRIKTIAWPPADFTDFLRQLMSAPEGMRGWHGGKKANYFEGRSQVIAVWWSDRLRRKHLRILGGAGGTLCRRIRYRAAGLGETPLSPLEQVYPDHTARYTHGGAPALLALCDCGAMGEPEALGWMGTCCGPCHDRRSEGEAALPRTAFHPCSRACLGVAFAPDSQTLACASSEITLRDLARGVTRKLDDIVPRRERSNAAFTADGRLVVVESDKVSLVDLKTDEISSWECGKAVWEAASADVSLLAFIAAKDRVEIRSSVDGTLRQMIEIEPGEGTPTINFGAGISCIAFSPDGKRLAIGRYSRPLQIRDVKTGAVVHEFACAHSTVEMAFSSDGAILAGGSLGPNREVLLWDLAIRQALPSLPLPRKHRLCSIAFAPRGRILIVGGDNGMMSLWDLMTDGPRLTLQWSDASYLSLASSPDGRWLAVAHNDGDGRLFPWQGLHALLAPDTGKQER